MKKLLVFVVLVGILLTSCVSPKEGPAGPQGPAGPMGPQGNPGLALDTNELLNDESFILSLKEELEAPTVSNPYMLAYQNGLEYVVPDQMKVPTDLLAGFSPVESLVYTNLVLPSGYKVSVPAAPEDVSEYSCFPQDYSEGDIFNRGCKELQEDGKLPWSQPLAGYNDGENWSCDSPNGWCADDIQALDWRILTAYEICHPAVGCLKDPNGGAVMILFLNFHDSDEVWGPRNDSAIYVDSGFIGYGRFFDFSGETYDVGFGAAAIRNQSLYNLSTPVGGDNSYSGQCGDSKLCETVTYVTVARVWDRPEIGIGYSHFELIDFGQWIRPTN